MVYNKSGVERSSIGKIDARTDNNVVRVGANRLRRAARLLLVRGEHNLRVQIQIIIPLGMQKHVRFISIIALIPEKLVGFRKGILPLCQFPPLGLDQLADWYLLSERL